MNKLSNLAETIPQGRMLRNALRIIKKRSNGIPTWAAVADICQVGSHHGAQICREIGVDADATRFKEIESVA